MKTKAHPPASKRPARGATYLEHGILFSNATPPGARTSAHSRAAIAGAALAKSHFRAAVAAGAI